MVENLIINALEAMKKKPGTLSIVAGTTEDGKPFFSVSDTGEGMSDAIYGRKTFPSLCHYQETWRRSRTLHLPRGSGGQWRIDRSRYQRKVLVQHLPSCYHRPSSTNAVPTGQHKQSHN